VCPTMILTGPRIHLKQRQPSEVLQWVESLPAEVRAEISADWLSAVSRLPRDCLYATG